MSPRYELQRTALVDEMKWWSPQKWHYRWLAEFRVCKQSNHWLFCGISYSNISTCKSSECLNKWCALSLNASIQDQLSLKKSLLGTSKISMHLSVWAKNLDKAGPMITDLKKRSICPQIYALVSVSTGRMWLILCSRSPGRRLKPPCVPWGCSPSARRQYPTWRPWMQSENELKCVQEALLREEQNTSDFSGSNRYFPADFWCFKSSLQLDVGHL